MSFLVTMLAVMLGTILAFIITMALMLVFYAPLNKMFMKKMFKTLDVFNEED